MKPYQQYKSQQQTNWTRIQMLLTLYRETESSIRAGIDSLRLDRRGEFTLTQIRTLKLLLALLDGVKVERDELAGNVHQLLLFVFQQVSREEIEGLENGLRVLITLKESFEAIEDEANQLESEGSIPQVRYDLDGTLAVG